VRTSMQEKLAISIKCTNAYTPWKAILHYIFAPVFIPGLCTGGRRWTSVPHVLSWMGRIFYIVMHYFSQNKIFRLYAWEFLYRRKLFFFEAGSCYIAQADLNLVILLPQSPKQLGIQAYTIVPSNIYLLPLC
jgi:hypothetical protein